MITALKFYCWMIPRGNFWFRMIPIVYCGCRMITTGKFCCIMIATSTGVPEPPLQRTEGPNGREAGSENVKKWSNTTRLATAKPFHPTLYSIHLDVPVLHSFKHLNIHKVYQKKNKAEKRKNKDKKEFSRSQRLKALLEPPPVNPQNRSLAIIEMQELV